MAEVHTTRAHAKLSPSSAHRWVNCPGSVAASEGIDPRTSVYAAEGTAAHELAAAVLTADWPSASAALGLFVNIEATDNQHLVTPKGPANDRTIFEVTDEMVDAVDTYVNVVRGLIEGTDTLGIVDIEQRLDMTHLHPAIFGTGDAVVYDPVGQHLHVCDFKYGKGVIVGVEQNPQLFLYAAGAARRYHNHPLRKLSLHVVQPRAAGEPIKTWETDVLDLLDFEGEIAVAAKATEAPDAPRRAGEWCRFCLAAPICPVNRQAALKDALAEFDDVTGEITLPELGGLTAEQRGQILRGADRIENWVKAIQEFEHANAMNGNAPAGFKLVAKRATRKWTDEHQAQAKAVALNVHPFAEPKMLSPAQIEKLVGKSVFAKDLADLVVQQSSGTNLVPMEDPRPAVAVGALAEFAAVDVEK